MKIFMRILRTIYHTCRGPLSDKEITERIIRQIRSGGVNVDTISIFITL